VGNLEKGVLKINRGMRRKLSTRRRKKDALRVQLFERGVARGGRLARDNSFLKQEES